MQQQDKPIKNRSLQSDENLFSVRDWLDLILHKWYWFLASAFFCVLGARVYYSTLTPLFKKEMVLLVKSEDSASGNLAELLGLPSAGGGNSGIETELFMLRTRQLLTAVVEGGLNVNYSYSGRFREQDVYGKTPFVAHFLDTYSGVARLDVKSTDEGNCRLSGFSLDGVAYPYEQTVVYGDTVVTPIGRVLLTPVAGNTHNYIGKEIHVTRLAPQAVAASLQNALTTAPVGKSSLVKVTCVNSSTHRAADILNTLFRVYTQTVVDDKNQVAANTARFIDDRLNIISRELGSVEDEIASFKQTHKLISVEANGEQFLQESQSARQESIRLEAQLSLVRFISQSLSAQSEEYRFIPVLSGLTDGGISSLVSSYNELLMQRNRLLSQSGVNNPLVKELDRQLSSLRVNLSGSIDSYIRTLNVQLEHSRRLEAASEKSLSDVPIHEKYALDVARQQSIKEALYTFLLQKREETAMQLAITESNIRMVEAPYGVELPVSPQKRKILAAALLIGLVLPLLFFRFRDFMNTGVRGRKDIERNTTIPFLGEVPESKNNTMRQVVVDVSKTDPVTEAFRILRSNLEFVAKDAQVLMFTSTMPGEGKTFVSRNMAAMLAMSGKKVIMIDTDLRKRTQSKLVGGTLGEGLSTWLSGSTTTLRSIILHDEDGGRIDVIPVGIVPPNPSELLMSDRFDELVTLLRKEYDYIILDNVPALVIADASVVNRVADLTIYVVRQGMLDRRYLPELEQIHQSDKFKNMCVVLNGVDLDKHHNYGYYGYGYSYGYSYSYGEQSGKRRVASRKSFVKRMFGRK